VHSKLDTEYFKAKVVTTDQTGQSKGNIATKSSRSKNFVCGRQVEEKTTDTAPDTEGELQ
jgi:hypothetical protein